MLKDYEARTQENWRKRQKRILINLDLEKDADTLAWIRSQVNNDSEIPAFIKSKMQELAKQ